MNWYYWLIGFIAMMFPRKAEKLPEGWQQFDPPMGDGYMLVRNERTYCIYPFLNKCKLFVNGKHIDDYETLGQAMFMAEQHSLS